MRKNLFEFQDLSNGPDIAECGVVQVERGEERHQARQLTESVIRSRTAARKLSLNSRQLTEICP
jgi:hypothetical protein